MEIIVTGVKELIAKLDDKMLDKPLRNFFNRATITIQGRARHNAPVITGRLRASIFPKVDTAHPPIWAKVGTNVKYAASVEYGFGRRPRYLRDAFKDSLGDVKGFLRQMAAEIQAAWGK